MLVAVSAALFLPAAGHAEQTLLLDSHNPLNQDSSATPAQSAPIPAGETYYFTITGTVSPWGPERYTGTGICGMAEAAPMTPTPGQPATPAGWDAATVFAAPNGAGIQPIGVACAPTLLPQHVTPESYIGFKYAIGDTPYVRTDPLGGPRTTPRSDHSYTWQVTGNGGPIRFRFADIPAFDNSGIFTIKVQSAAECAASNCTGATTPQSDQATLPTVATSPGNVAVLGERVCKNEKVLTVRLQPKKGLRFAKTVYHLAGAPTRSVTGQKKLYITQWKNAKWKGQLRAVKFRNLPSGPLHLMVDATTTSGQRLKLTTTFVRCQPRIKARPVTATKT